MMSNIGSPWCYDTAAFCVRDPLDARRWANVCGDLGTPGQVRPAGRGDWGQLPLAIVLCRKSHKGKAFPRCDPLFTIIVRNLFEPQGCRVISMKLLRTICAILLIAGAGAVMFASSNSASAQAADPNSEQSRNARIVKRLKPDERARFEAECKSAAQQEQNECVVTRAFVVQCRAVVDKRLEPTLLWAYPGNFIVKYLSPDEKPMVLQALRESTAALESLAGKSK